MLTMNRIGAAVLLALSATSLALAAAPAGNLAATMNAATPAANSAPAPAFDLDADVASALKAFDVPGVAIAIVKDGKVLVAKGFGVRKLGEPTPVDARTLFEVASNSKAFTATALAMLVDEGKLAWDDPVTKYLPGFQMNDSYVTGQMTVRDLLTHRSGLGLGAGDLLWWPSSEFSSDEIIQRLRYIKPATSFRASYAYDNLLYIAAGKIVAEQAGKPWGAAIRERILTPLGMNTTTTSLADNAGNPDVSSPHSRIDGKQSVVKPMPVPNAAGAVGINTNAEDIARWMMVLLDGGKLDSVGGAPGARLFSAARGREMWSAQTPMNIAAAKPGMELAQPNFNAYALAFNVRDYRGMKVAMHGGALQGFYSRVMMLPDAKLGIAILTNAENSGIMTALGWRIADHYIDAKPVDWIGIVSANEQNDHKAELARLGKQAVATVAKSPPSLPLDAYDGDYQDPWYGKVSIAREGKQHVLRFARTPDLGGALEHYQHDTFIVHWKERNFNADAYVTFALNPDGSVERIKMKPISTETDFSYDFQDLVLTPVKEKKTQP